MNPRTTDRIFAALGGSFVVLTLLGTALAGEVHGGTGTTFDVNGPSTSRHW